MVQLGSTLPLTEDSIMPLAHISLILHQFHYKRDIEKTVLVFRVADGNEATFFSLPLSTRDVEYLKKKRGLSSIPR